MPRRTRLLRLFLTSALPAALLAGPAVPETLIGTGVNSYGLPGAVEMPTAEAFEDGTLSATVGISDYDRRNTIAFQIMPRVTAALRYSRVEGLDQRRGYIWDRSFDLRYQALDESGWRPAVAIGLQDFLGTGVYSGEYVVATKTLNPRLRVSAGLAWGRLAGEYRQADYTDEGGKPNVDDWFTGSAKPFASVTWQATDKLRLAAEYSNDNYGLEVTQGAEEPGSKFNLSATYRFGEYYEVGVYTIGGDSFGAQFNIALNANKPAYPSGLEPAPAPVRPRPAPSADPEGWSGAWSADPTAQPAIQKALGDALAKEGQILESMALSANRAEVRIRNGRYLQQAEALGRTARLMTRALPPSVETFVITSVETGIPVSSTVLRRSDIERLENRPVGEIAQVATVTNADPRPAGLVRTPGLFPRFQWAIRPYLTTSLFDPDDPLRYEVGGRASLRYEPLPGLVLSGSIRQRAFGSIEQDGPSGLTPDEYLALDTDIGPFGVPRVRSDGRMYSGNDSPVITDLTLAWYAHPSEAIYTRVEAGLLERAFGGASAEVLWKPADSRLALGAEISRVRKRDFEDMFGFRDYETTTGFVSAYYDFGGGYLGQIDAGKYLAGDVGATVTVSREFANGWKVGAYASKTDLSAEEFGEGSFDKGITISVPLSWATGQPTTDRIGGTIRSLSRDGGTRLRSDGRLYDNVRQSHSGKIYEGWGKFWR
ncbi:YjbH domain-containing protein [Paracoccus sp. TK19116]|uniref:YjbH domain-containing protein n=1 Tax=Paracoccus albicereus TaxID=2922394 RepID=A0ABT1MR25_9RHOB|nr:YjbH domain-containing protein [Paracoccus albicereus]MCQ0970661.1 YjbH domain-containing protein [Paracoccus albicereus]